MQPFFNFDEPEIKTDNLALDNLPEKKMVEIVSKATGIPFEYKDELFGYVYEKDKVRYEIKYSNFNMTDDHGRFISCGWCKLYGNYEGVDNPVRTVEEAIKFFNSRKGK